MPHLSAMLLGKRPSSFPREAFFPLPNLMMFCLLQAWLDVQDGISPSHCFTSTDLGVQEAHRILGRWPGCEVGKAGVVVQLLDVLTSKVVASATTDAAGHYSFTGLAAGTYNVTFQPVAGYAFSAFPGGSTGPITLAANQTYLDADMGLYQGADVLPCVLV